MHNLSHEQVLDYQDKILENSHSCYIDKLNKLSQADLTFFFLMTFSLKKAQRKQVCYMDCFKKLGIIYLVSKQTPLVNIPKIVQASLRHVATAATL